MPDSVVYLDQLDTEDKIRFYEAILAGLLRKYLAEGNKIEINLNHIYKDTDLNVMLIDQSIAKVSWREINADI
jgi:hypothetical protein